MVNTINQVETQALQQIAHELKRMNDIRSPTQALGFGAAPKTQQWVFCNRKHGGVWYTLNEQSQPVNVDQPALTGYIRKLEFKKTMRRNEKAHKLHCHIEADRLYVLESAHDSNFSKGLLSTIATIPLLELKQPITIVPQASTENSEVLFCNVYQGDRQVFAPYDNQTDWKKISRVAIDVVTNAQ